MTSEITGGAAGVAAGCAAADSGASVVNGRVVMFRKGVKPVRGGSSSSGCGRSAALGNQYPLRRKYLNRRGFVSIVGRGALLASDRGDLCRFLGPGGLIYNVCSKTQ